MKGGRGGGGGGKLTPNPLQEKLPSKGPVLSGLRKKARKTLWEQQRKQFDCHYTMFFFFSSYLSVSLQTNLLY